MMKLLCYAILFAFLAGCASEPASKVQVFIRDTVYTVVPPAIVDSGIAQTVTDTLVRFVQIRNTDTVADIRYYPIEKFVKYWLQPDTVRITARDTLVKSEVIEKVIETTWFEKFGIAALGAVVALIAIALIALWKKKNG
jgi:hypothetical protein